jgi:hypothetical protein
MVLGVPWDPIHLRDMNASAPARRRLLAVVAALSLVLLSGNCGSSGGGTTSTATRLTSPDGRTDLVLSVRSGGGAAGFADEDVALVPHGRPAESDDRLATFDPDDVLGARWLARNVVEVGLGSAARSGSLPSLVRVGGRLVALRTRDLAHCRPVAVSVLARRPGMTLLASVSACGDGVGRLSLSWPGDAGLSAQLADAVVAWPTPLAVRLRGGVLALRARRIYGGPRRERVGGPDGQALTLAWLGG